MGKHRIVAKQKADADHQVVTVMSEGDKSFVHRKTPCDECPWRRDSPIGAFPAEAYRISAHTAYDMNRATFACHMKGKHRPAVCAGFLLRGAYHNMGVRMAIASGRYDPDSVSEAGCELYESYREMAEVNGVAPDDPVLRDCR